MKILGKGTGRNENEWKTRPFFKKSFTLSEVAFVQKSLSWEPGTDAKLNVILPDFVVDYHADWWSTWEAARFADMKSKLKQGDILFDVGSETGWVSCIYAQFVGGENMCLFEPESKVWPNIKATWLANGLKAPRATFVGLVGDISIGACNSSVWPDAANSQELIGTAHPAYKYIGDKTCLQVSLDDFVRETNIVPDALSIDVEGAEYLVLQGAKEILKKHRPIVWLSIHYREDIMKYGGSPEQIHEMMHELGYKDSFLGNDHEEHWVYECM